MAQRLDLRSFTTAIGLVALTGMGVGLAGCGGGDEGGTVKVVLQEFAVVPASASVSAGDVTFEAENTGPADPHELVVIQTDLAPDALPTGEDGGVLEDGAGIKIIGEIEEFAVGEKKSATYNLTKGKYVLICNLVEEEEGDLEAHYQLGMRVAFTVN